MGNGRVKPIRVVCATRGSRECFYKGRPLGQSLKLFAQSNWQGRPIELCLFEHNTVGLPVLYNRAIEHAVQNPAVLLFIHDDILLTDLFWWERIHEGLEKFDIIGLVGSKDRHQGQATWFCHTPEIQPDMPLLSGRVQDGDGISNFGASGEAVKLMDGALLAVDSATLVDSGLRFDEQFTFDLYDLDMCRQAELRGLTMGTVPISVIHHGSPRQNAYAAPEWFQAVVNYLHKYDEQPYQRPIN